MGSVGDRNVDSIHGSELHSECWCDWTCVSPGVWRRVDLGARSFVVPRSLKMRRRVTRYLKSGVLLGDSWVSGRTPDRVVRKQFRVPRDIEITIGFVGHVDVEQGAVVEWGDRPMEPSDATQYRARVARLNFLSIDRSDLQFCCKDSARKMTTPTNGDWKAMKRFGRYLIGRPRVVHFHFWQHAPFSYACVRGQQLGWVHTN